VEILEHKTWPSWSSNHWALDDLQTKPPSCVLHLTLQLLSIVN